MKNASGLTEDQAHRIKTIEPRISPGRPRPSGKGYMITWTIPPKHVIWVEGDGQIEKLENAEVGGPFEVQYTPEELRHVQARYDQEKRQREVPKSKSDPK
jgi:hypothetical protein